MQIKGSKNQHLCLKGFLTSDCIWKTVQLFVFLNKHMSSQTQGCFLKRFALGHDFDYFFSKEQNPSCLRCTASKSKPFGTLTAQLSINKMRPLFLVLPFCFIWSEKINWKVLDTFKNIYQLVFMEKCNWKKFS